MTNWEAALVGPDVSILAVMETISRSRLQIALVVDDERTLLGTVTDGDVRRGLLSGITLDNPVTAIMRTSPTVGHPDTPRRRLLALMQERSIHQIPIVDAARRVVGLELLGSLLESPRLDNWVVLMAGGLGSRLHPLTVDTPKPMLPIGGRPILETLVTTFAGQGFSRFFLAVNYLAGVIEEHFGDGRKWDVEIGYLRERERLGTAGALALLPERPTRPIIVMNGDLLTKIDFDSLLRFHEEQNAIATMCVRPYEITVPFGVARIDEDRLIGLDEKPTQKFFINAGIYVLSPEALEAIPQGMSIDMTSLFERLIAQGRSPAVFPIQEYWIDVGRIEDLERADGEFHTVFN